MTKISRLTLMKAPFAMLIALSVLAACSSGDECGEPAYNGSATDEAWRTMIDGEKIVKVGDARAATMIEPAEGQTYAKTSPAPTLRWMSPLTASLDPSFQPSRRRTRDRSMFDQLEDVLVRSAWAHGAPVNGPIHDLKITVPSRTCPVEILTTTSTHTFSDAQWALLRANAGKTLSLEITSAFMRENRITEGPFRPSAPRTFTVTE